MADVDTQVLPLLPLPAGVVLPHMVVTLALETAEARAAGEAARATGGRLVLVPRTDGRYARVGTVARIENEGELPDGPPALVVRGLHRAVIGAGVPGSGDALHVQVDVVDEGPPTEVELALAREYRVLVEEILERRGARRMAGFLQGAESPGALADTAGYWPELDADRRVQLLETTDVEARLELVVAWARDALADLAVREQVRDRVTDGMETEQREALLRRQLDAIRRELGDGDDDVVGGYRSRLEELAPPVPVREAVERQLGRLERTSSQSPEQGWIRAWIDTVLDVPWGAVADERVDLDGARAVLDDDHEGLDRIKDRVLELLAVRNLRAQRDRGALGGRGSGAILLLVGPPGVGKTSLGASIARATGRPFARVSVGGVRDEAEIRGHRRTYVGAQPGRFVRALVEAGAMNPVLLVDEIDKVGADWRGDPASALLEVLDPEQNHTFRDHYLELDLDLSNVLFVATANVVETIPAPLLDRMEVVHLEGYSEDEKLAIARRHLLPRQRERSGLDEHELEVTDDALRAVIGRYTREAGVRALERELGTLARKSARRVAAGDDVTVTVDEPALRELLGRPRVPRDHAELEPVPGVVTGLAVTGAGGDVLAVEATSMAGEAGLQITGQLGEVMTESARIALSFVQSHADELGIAQEAFEDRRFHLHVPAGAIPKDGPSAGITMTTALVGLLARRPVRPRLAMTGEVTLQGRVLPIGGVKQKVLAAHRAGVTEVLLPADNEGDLDDVPDSVRAEMVFHPVGDVREVLRIALGVAAAVPAA